MNGWYAFDLDGTLAEYDHWRGFEHIGTPIPHMVALVKQMLAEGKDCRIFTARAADDDSGRPQDAVRALIEKWCETHIGRVLPITCTKDYGMVVLYDDRCKQVVPNLGITVESERDAWKRAAENRGDQVTRLQRELSAFKSEYYNGY